MKNETATPERATVSDNNGKDKKKELIRQRYIKPDAVRQLENAVLAEKAKRYKSTEPELLVRPDYTDKTANGLTKCIIHFVRLQGGQAERISTTGRPIDRRQKYTDAIGMQRVIGSIKWIKGTGTKGSADISATIAGRSVKIEVKIGADRQSEAQKQYQADIEKAGGSYYIAKDFTSFVEWYNQTFGKGANNG